jgi:hypothetical protein
MVPASFNTPASWSNQPMLLYHGTTSQHANLLRTNGVNPLLGRTHTDFGVGFYTTTLQRQAESWAWQAAQTAIAAGNSGVQGRVLVYTLDRDSSAGLDTLAFVRGDHGADDYWSFIFHCRQGNPGHGRVSPLPPTYDIVYGPVTAFWQQRVIMGNADQVSFHTLAAASLLAYQNTINMP